MATESPLPIKRKRKQSPDKRTPEQHRERQRLFRQRLREWVSGLKVEAGCADCGYNAHPAALDFDHLPGTEKTLDVTQLVHGMASRARILAEIAKCEVVCANCHRVRTHVRGQNAHWPRAV